MANLSGLLEPTPTRDETFTVARVPTNIKGVFREDTAASFTQRKVAFSDNGFWRCEEEKDNVVKNFKNRDQQHSSKLRNFMI